MNNTKSIFLYLSCLLFCASLQDLAAQKQKAPYDVYYIGLKDKENTPYSVFKGNDYLSARALERRALQGIFLDSLDLPIAPLYIENIEQLGTKVLQRSKWLNALAVHVTDSNQIAALKALPFVHEVYALGYFRAVKTPRELKRVIRDTMPEKKSYYGAGEHQAKMLQVPQLHDMGLTGKGIHIAIFDGGFENAYRMAAFDSLYANGQILGTKDFVEGDDFVYEDSGHGTDVLSCMGAIMPHRLVGTAPDAQYYLFKTEDSKGEYWTEEFSWVAAAEYADSLGVDIINSSLGYTQFNDTAMNHDYHRDLNGRTTIAARGANIGVNKGLIIANSAGNEGSRKWHYIGTPADAPNVLAIAATDASGAKANFSSVGPGADGLIKPNLAAQGRDAVVASPLGMVVKMTNGTSFSSPILAGAIGALRQKFRAVHTLTYKDVLEQTAHQGQVPDSLLGFGIPQLMHTYMALENETVVFVDEFGNIKTNAKFMQKHIEVLLEKVQDMYIEISLVNIQLGKELFKQQMPNSLSKNDYLYAIDIPTENLSKGVYALIIRNETALNNTLQYITLIKN